MTDARNAYGCITKLHKSMCDTALKRQITIVSTQKSHCFLCRKHVEYKDFNNLQLKHSPFTYFKAFDIRLFLGVTVSAAALGYPDREGGVMMQKERKKINLRQHKANKIFTNVQSLVSPFSFSFGEMN